jgi:hypothetical protein
MASKKLASLMQSVPPATARAVPESSVPPPAVNPEPPPRRIVPEVVAVAHEEPEVPLQVLIPAGVREQLGIMVARERGASLRSLILRAVRSLGVEVTDEEIKGKRGRRRP